jgi:hypothetical protein
MIYTNGCSLTYGDELTDKTKAWPYLLAKKLNTEVLNDAVNGGTNYRTVYLSTKNIKENYDLYIVAWTNCARYTYYKSDNNFEINFNPQLNNSLCGNEKFYSQWGKDLYLHWHNELYAFKIWLQQIVQLQATFEKFQKNYLMINTFSNNLDKWLASKDKFSSSVKNLINFDIMSDQQIFAEYEEIQYYISCIDTENFYQWNDFFITDLTNKFSTGPNGHILDAGHEYVSDLLYQHIQCLK